MIIWKWAGGKKAWQAVRLRLRVVEVVGLMSVFVGPWAAEWKVHRRGTQHTAHSMHLALARGESNENENENEIGIKHDKWRPLRRGLKGAKGGDPQEQSALKSRLCVDYTYMVYAQSNGNGYGNAIEVLWKRKEYNEGQNEWQNLLEHQYPRLWSKAKATQGPALSITNQFRTANDVFPA